MRAVALMLAEAYIVGIMHVYRRMESPYVIELRMCCYFAETDSSPSEL